MFRRFSQSVALLALVVLPSAAQASLPASECSKLPTIVDNAKVIVAAHATSVTTATKEDVAYVRVTYLVDESIYGTKLTELLVEETCDPRTVPMKAVGTPAVEGYCTSSDHFLPGLKSDGALGGGKAALILSEPTKSPQDGKDVWRVAHDGSWGACPDEAALVKKRPALKDLLTKVRALQSTATFGFPTIAAVADAGNAPPTAAAPSVPAADAGPKVGPAPASPPQAPASKSSGCNAAPGMADPDTAGLAGLMIVLFCVGRASAARDRSASH